MEKGNKLQCQRCNDDEDSWDFYHFTVSLCPNSCFPSLYFWRQGLGTQLELEINQACGSTAICTSH